MKIMTTIKCNEKYGFQWNIHVYGKTTQIMFEKTAKDISLEASINISTKKRLINRDDMSLLR